MKRLFTILLLIPLFATAQDPQILYKLEELGKNVNTRYHETAPLITSDNQRLYFTVSNHPENTNGTDNTQDIWYSDRLPDGTWGKAQHMESPLNKRKFNQVLSILDYGNTLLIRGGKSKKKEGFSLVFRNGDSWSKPENLDIQDFEEMNNGRFSGAVITQDRATIVIYMSERTGKAYSDLYVSKLQPNGSYSKPELITSLSTPQDEFGQYLADNDKTMYFASNRQGTMGDVDVWKTERLDDTWQKWSEPENIGPPINTSGFDSYFSIDATGKHAFTTRTYVSADGSNMNIYGLVPKPKITVKGTVRDTKTGEAVALQLEVNEKDKNPKILDVRNNGEYSFTTYEEKPFLFSAQKNGYLDLEDTIDLRHITKDTTLVKDLFIEPIKSEIFLYGYILESESKFPVMVEISAKQNKWNKKTTTNFSDGQYRIQLKDEGVYSISINDSIYEPITEEIKVKLEKDVFYKEIRKDFLLDKSIQPYVLSGYVYDKKTKEPLAASVSLDLNDTLIVKTESDSDGFYTVQLKKPTKYKIHAAKADYLNLEESVSVFDNQDFLNYNKDLFLDPIEVGVTVIIKNIYFNFDKSDLKTESFPELNRLTNLMQTNPGITIEIAGHTDDKGSDDYNMDLSDGRARAVMNYLLEQGIDPDRMLAKGYGESQPISTNHTEEGRAENRRVVFTILSK
ncbi:OmpA family protein [Marivirga sp. S37H4]|uniref:OmpA family protein n=1 Tax=Marivirga aurantiaca TaxID=2802615 RepID=A0A934X1P8_9BACT|nr:OmpA family protein [Marivirga aurantiaca]MBK6267368.1 OmpA family protein [Marivirga aurantiaca]